MKNPTRILITRESLLTTASSNTRWFASLVAGGAVLGTSALHAALWDGSESRDWNTAANWNTNALPGQNADINTDLSTVNVPLISADLLATPVDIQVGIVDAGATPGSRLDHTAGNASTGESNWMFVGARNAGAKGIYNLSDPAGSGGIFTGHGISSGNMDVGGASATNGRLYIGGDDGGGDGGTGVINVNTSGTLTIGNDFFVGSENGTGTANIDNGTITAGSVASGCWGAFGRSGGTGTLNMSGGTLTYYGALWVPRDTNSDGFVNLRGGTLETRTHGEGFVIAEGGTTTGTVLHTGGAINTTDRDFTVGRNGGGTATYTINTTHGASTNTCARFLVAVGSGTTGTANLDGGTLTTSVIDGGAGSGAVYFNGTQINASQNNTDFINGLITAEIKAGDLLINSGAFNLTASQALSGAADGDVVKTGSGSLSLLGSNSYEGDNIVNAGTLTLSAAGLGTGAISMADGTTLGVTAPVVGDQLTASSATFGVAGNTTLNLSLGDLNGTNPSNSILDVTGTLTLNGTVAVNVAGTKFAVGTIPLITFGSLAGAGSFDLVNLPPGVVATPVVTATGLSLNVTSVALPKWTGLLVPRFTTGSPTTASNDVTVANNADIAIGQTVTGPGIDVGTTVTNVAGNVITLSTLPLEDGTDVNLMFAAGPGANPGVWDIATTNWVDQVSGSASSYANPNPVLFDDDAPGSTTVTLDTSVSPSIATFNNSALSYTLTGTGEITGTGSLVKQGSGNLTMSIGDNTYDGPTRLQGGSVTVATIEDLGVPSPIGDTSELVIAGGFLNYTGPADTTTRGMTLDAPNGGINTAANLTFSGQILNTGTGGNLRKQGAGVLAFTFGGVNTLSSNGQPVDVEAGTLVLDGTAGGQVNSATGEFWVGSEPDVAASLSVTNTTLNISSWLAVGRGNGNDGVTNVNMTNSTVQTGNFSAGWNNGLSNNASETVITLTDTTWTNAGLLNFAESPDSTVTGTLTNSTWISNTGDARIAQGLNTTGNLTISGTSELRVGQLRMGMADGAVATVIIEGNGKLTKTGASFMSIGDAGTGQGTLTVRDSGMLNLTGSELNIADQGTSSGTLNLEEDAIFTNVGALLLAKNSGTTAELNISGNATITTSGNWIAGGAEGQTATPLADATINQNGGSITLNGDDNRTGGTGTAEWNISAGSVTSNGWMTLGRYAGGTGVMNASGGTVTQNHASRPFRIAEFGTGILNVSGTAVVSAPNAGGFQMGGGTTGVGTINIDGGTLVANRIYSGGNDLAQKVSLDGGTLQAATGANLNFIAAQIGEVKLEANNADIDSTIDTNGQTVAINKPISDGGGNLIKSGAGTLQLNSANSYLGTTTVTEGTLGGNGSLDGPLQIDADASVNPGTSAGTFSAFDSVNLDGTYVCEIDGAVSDQLAVAGTLTIDPDAILDFSELSAPAASVFIIASYGTLDGAFAPENVLNLPSGYTLDYNYLGGNQIALVQAATPYTTWASSFGLDPFTDGAPGFDKDNDGQLNSLEFALGGSPIDGSDNAKVFSSVADSNDGDSDEELLMTIAVRTGAGSFTGTPPSLNRDGFTYAIQGSTTLADFTLPAAVEVGAIAPPAPDNVPPAGYEWHTFKLSGSEGLPNKGFLRVLVTP